MSAAAQLRRGDRTNDTAWLVSFGPVGARSDGYLVRAEVTARALKALGFRVGILEVSNGRGSRNDVDDFDIRLAAPRLATARRLLGRFNFVAEVRTQLALVVGLIRNRRQLAASKILVIQGGGLASAFLMRLIRKNHRQLMIFDSTGVMSEIHRHGDRVTDGPVCTAGCKTRRLVWRCLELFCSRFADVTVVVRPDDAAAFRGSRVHVVPHGVLDAFFSTGIREDPGLIGFVGSGRLAANREAIDFLARELSTLPTLRSVRCRVIGEAGFGLVHERFEFSGFSRSLQEALAPISVCCAPMRDSGGVSTKVLASLLSGKRTVCTPEAAHGIARPAYGLWVAERVDFGSAVSTALASPWSPRESEEVRATVLSSHGLDAIAKSWGSALGCPVREAVGRSDG